MHLYVLNRKYFSQIWKNNPSLSKSTLKYLVYCQVSWVKVRCLQDQYRSIWTLVFHYFDSISCNTKKVYKKRNSINSIFPICVFKQKYILFHIQKLKEFYCRCYVVKLFLYFSFFLPFNVFSVCECFRFALISNYW